MSLDQSVSPTLGLVLRLDYFLGPSSPCSWSLWSCWHLPGGWILMLCTDAPVKFPTLVRIWNSLTSAKYSFNDFIVCSSPKLWARWARRPGFRKSQCGDNMKNSSLILEAWERRAAWNWRNSPHCCFRDAGRTWRHLRIILTETPPFIKAFWTVIVRSAYFSSNCLISSFRLNCWACASLGWFAESVLLGGVREVGGVRGVGGVSRGRVGVAASSEEVSWSPNVEN